MPGGTITGYLDCVSPFSYIALVHLEKHRALLESHNVEINIVPVFLGGIMQGSGNQPPWLLGAKAAAMKYEFGRAKAHFGLPRVKTPAFFPIVSLLPQRALVYVKAAYPQRYLQVFLDMYRAMWEDNQDLSKPELLAAVLAKHFEEKQVREILRKASAPENKQTLNANTKEALERGAYGCPWFWVKNSEGKEEPFFGSDRFHYMWQLLGLPWKDIELLAPAEKAKI